MKAYADTNLFLRLYLELADSSEADDLISLARQGPASPLPITWLHRVEFVNALELHVFLARQPGHVRVTPEQAAVAWVSFQDDLANGAFLRPARLSDWQVEEEFAALSRRFTARQGFRTYDLLHVTAARLLGCDTFWSFDERASKLAGLAGLKIRARSSA
jgi:predicted nucleic acid-binding protein